MMRYHDISYLFSNEFFLIDYLMKVGCFDANYIESAYQCEGYFDQ